MKYSHIKDLEENSIYLLREAYATFQSLGMLWSIGKDSTVMLWLARKAFQNHVPFPLIHIDTSFKIPEMISYRDEFAKKWNLDLIVGSNDSAIKQKETYPDRKLNRVDCCRALKTEALNNALKNLGNRKRLNLKTGKLEADLSGEAFNGIIAGIRADEERSRSKERYFSPRNQSNEWDIKSQPPEFWHQYKLDFAPNTHVRIHPLLDWSELNIWEYIEQENIPTVSLYYDQGNAQRYRSLGCFPCTTPIASTAKNPLEIIKELRDGKLQKISERSGRAQDAEDGGGLETLRRNGYM
jgi:sulfate adenylyltransferase subunit 2